LTLTRDTEDRLLLRWGETTFDLSECVVRHRDEDRRIEFSVTRPDGSGKAIRYRRKGPSLSDLAWDFIDFTADEPWTWEDSDFGLFVFHVATRTGPVKYRHLVVPRSIPPEDYYRTDYSVDDRAVTRRVWQGRTERARFDELSEVRAKFEVSGIWAEPTLIVLHSASDLAVIPIYGHESADRAHRELLPRLRGLPGWTRASEAAFADACRYPVEPRLSLATFSSRAERPIWAAP